jgi:hypothetical protein
MEERRMKVLRHGSLFLFQCDICGCIFVEAESKTEIAHAAIWVPEKEVHGVRMQCPDCRNDVIGIPEKNGKKYMTIADDAEQE